MNNLKGNNLYFDVAATTPLDLEVIEEMHEINKINFGNPSSIHQFGQQAHNVLERSRKNISTLLSRIEYFLKFLKKVFVPPHGISSEAYPIRILILFMM